MTRWTEAREDILEGLWAKHRGRIGVIAKEMGVSRNTIVGKSRQMALHFPPTGATKASASAKRAAMHNRSIFFSRVVDVTDGILKTGANQRKIGPVVTKGKWKNFPIYSLTLEERATCPRTCEQFETCYGNHMGNAKRYRNGDALIEQLVLELHALNRKYPSGFVVRLHILGDFFSTDYVEFWGHALDLYPALRIFGYTHRRPSDPIGEALVQLRAEYPERFAIRSSDAPTGYRTHVVPDRAAAKALGAITCPAQTHWRVTCGTCGLCWNSTRAIAFLGH